MLQLPLPRHDAQLGDFKEEVEDKFRQLDASSASAAAAANTVSSELAVEEQVHVVDIARSPGPAECGVQAFNGQEVSGALSNAQPSGE